MNYDTKSLIMVKYQVILIVRYDEYKSIRYITLSNLCSFGRIIVIDNMILHKPFRYIKKYLCNNIYIIMLADSKSTNIICNSITVLKRLSELGEAMGHWPYSILEPLTLSTKSLPAP